MNKHKLNQSGAAHLTILVVIVVVAVAGLAFYRMQQMQNKSDSSSDSSTASSAEKIKHIGITLGSYDAAAQTFGDVMFTKLNVEGGSLDSVFQEYGRLGGAGTPGGERRNPQPTFVVKPGTKVHALVDGTVVNVPKLYSNDYSVHVQPKGSELIFETEHVQNVKVKVGDTVKAGDVVAEASDYDARNLNGLSLIEIGVLIPGNPPKHACTFDYLDDSIKADTLKQITALENAWEEYMGDSNLFKQESEPIPGCITREQIEG